jgi:predicted ATP-binding protein involved in virulence
LNHDLVAIIGNKGNGKSALTDIIALCGNTKVPRLSFLTEDRFCNSSQKKAEDFEAISTWESGLSISKKLSDSVANHESELVRYVPQSFLKKSLTKLQFTKIAILTKN